MKTPISNNMKHFKAHFLVSCKANEYFSTEPIGKKDSCQRTLASCTQKEPLISRPIYYKIIIKKPIPTCCVSAEGGRFLSSSGWCCPLSRPERCQQLLPQPDSPGHSTLSVTTTARSTGSTFPVAPWGKEHSSSSSTVVSPSGHST